MTREAFMDASDVKTPANLAATIDRLLDSASRKVEKRLHRHFYPLTEAVTFTFSGGGSGFWLDRDLFTLTAATVDTVAQTVSAVELYPSHYGPPYSWVELMGSEVVLTGDWGFTQDTVAAGTLDGNITIGALTLDLSDSSLVGVGDLITIDTERLLVTEKTLKDTTADLASNLTADTSEETVTLDNAALVSAGEIVTLDSERMKIIGISGNVLSVKRAWDGSTLAAHTGAVNVFAPLTCTVERAATGSTAAAQTTGVTVFRNVAPGPVRDLCLAEALVTFQQEHSAYGRTVGSGDNERESAGRGLSAARKDAGGYLRARLAAA